MSAPECPGTDRAITLLRIGSFILTLVMAYTVIRTSLASNLFEEWGSLAAIPWMIATLKDFYALMVPVMLWMFYKESSVPARAIWALLFVALGSIATSAYIFLQLIRIPAGGTVESFLLRTRHA